MNFYKKNDLKLKSSNELATFSLQVLFLLVSSFIAKNEKNVSRIALYFF